MGRNPLWGRGFSTFTGLLGARSRQNASRKRNAFKLEALEQRALMAVVSPNPPALVDDAYTLDEDTVLTVPAAQGLLSNDSDLDGDTLTVTGVERIPHIVLDTTGEVPAADFHRVFIRDHDAPRVPGAIALYTYTPIEALGDRPGALYALPGVQGTLEVNADGSFTYTPNPNGYGTDVFHYSVSDGKGGVFEGTVSFTVNSVNDVPVVGDDFYTTSEDQPLEDIGFELSEAIRSNDSDADIWYTISDRFPFDTFPDRVIRQVHRQPSHGTLTMDLFGRFTYAPEFGFHGVDTFEYISTDVAGATDIGLVTITVNPVNDAPVASDDTYELDEDGSFTIPAGGLVANDHDADGDALTAMVSGGSLVSGWNPSGTLVQNADGSFTYTPNKDAFGTQWFHYTVSDGNGGTDTGAVKFIVKPVNDAPVASDDYFAIERGTPLRVSQQSILSNDHDPEESFSDGLLIWIVPRQPYSGSLAAALATLPEHGVVELNSDGTFTYTPNAGFFGNDSFTYTATDRDGLASTATVHLQIAEAVDLSLQPGSDDFFIKNLYQDVLDRDFDQVGYDFHLGLLTAGATRADVARSILGSTEYLENLVNKFYDAFLGRQAEDSALSMYRDALKTGAMSESDVIATILGSDEFFQRSGATPGGYIGAVYQNLLGRAADEEGLAFWTARLAAGASRTEVASGIASEREFLSLLLDDPVMSNRFRALDGWYHDYLGGQFNESENPKPNKEAYLNRLVAGGAWADVQSEILGLDEYYNSTVYGPGYDGIIIPDDSDEVADPS